MPGLVKTSNCNTLKMGSALVRRSAKKYSSSVEDTDVESRSDLRRLMQFDRRLPRELLNRLWEEPDQLIAESVSLKKDHRCTVVRIDCGGKSYVLKRYNLRGILHTFVHFLMLSRAQICWDFGRFLHRRGIRTPLPMAYLEHRFGPLKRRSFLITEYVEGVILSDHLSNEHSATFKKSLSGLIQQFGVLWQKLEKYRLSHGDMKASNFLVTRDESLWVIDLDGTQRHRSRMMWKRGRRKDRLRFMKNWRYRSDIGKSFAPVFDNSKRNVAASSARLNAFDRSELADAENQPVNGIWVASKYRRMLESAGLDRFETLMGTTDGFLMRRLENRENWRLDLVGESGQKVRAYLKKHHFRNRISFVRDALGLGTGKTPGRDEAEQIYRLDSEGIPTMSLIAFGERLADDGHVESLLLTEELTGFEQLDLFLPERFPETTAVCRKSMSKLIERVAEVAGNFHRLGYNHRDFYTCHFFIREDENGEFAVNLIDLQRVQKRRYFRGRWIIKDLAQLAYSCPASLIGNRERMQFIKRYLGVEILGRREKQLIRSVLRREAGMKQKLGAYR